MTAICGELPADILPRLNSSNSYLDNVLRILKADHLLRSYSHDKVKGYRLSKKAKDFASVAVSSKSKQLGTWRISNYTPEFRETSGVGKRPVLTQDEVMRLPNDQALIIIRGHKPLKVQKFDYSRHPESGKLKSCKASKYIPEWRKKEIETGKDSLVEPIPIPLSKKKTPRKKAYSAKPSSNEVPIDNGNAPSNGMPILQPSSPSPDTVEPEDDIISVDKNALLL